MARQMKDSGIGYVGSIPRHWTTVRLKYLTEIRSEKGLFNPDLALYIGLENIVGYSNGIFSTDATYDISVQNVCKKGDILFGKLRPYLAKVIFSPYDGYCSGEFLILSDFMGDKRFLRFSLLNKNFIDDINSSTYGAKMPRANSQYILNLAIALPSPLEQRRIADYLDAKCAEIDKVVEKTRETIEEYKKLKQSIITETVTKGLNSDAEMKDSGIPWIGKIPVNWKIGRVKEEFSVVLGKMLQTSPKSLNDTLENYACASNVKWSGYNADVSRKMWFSSTEKREYLLVNGDVLVMEGGTAGTSCIYQGENAPCYMQNSINRCRNMGGYPNKLLYYYLFHVFYCGYIESICNKSTISHYTKEKIENTPLVIPENHEQLRIVSFLDDKCAALDSIIEKKEQLIEELGSYRKSLIYEYVTGKKEVQA